jgi:hypothetical protein
MNPSVWVRKDSLSSRVSGHGFSRAVESEKSTGFSPWELRKAAGAEAPSWLCLTAPSKTLGVPSLYRVRQRPPIMSIGGVWAARAFAVAGSASGVAPSKTLGVPSLYRVGQRPPIMSIGGVWAARAFAAAGSASEAAPSKTLGVPSLYRVNPTFAARADFRPRSLVSAS